MSLIFLILLIFNILIEPCKLKVNATELSYRKINERAEIDKVTKFVDPLIGTQNEGHVFPNPCLPYGVVKVGFDTDDIKDNHAGYTVNGSITGISHLHVSGTGGEPKYGVISQFPLTSTSLYTIPLHNYTSLRSFEHFEVGYSKFGLKRYNVTIELTAARRTGVHSSRYRGGSIYSVSPSQITGVGHYSGGWNEGSKYTVYFCSQFNKNASSFGTFWKSFINENATFLSSFDIPFDTPAIGAVLGFDFDSNMDESGYQACKSAQEEVPNFDFEKTRELAVNAWETELSKIRVDGGEVGSDLKTIFYSSLYRTMIIPSDRTGENSKWSSYDNEGKLVPNYDDLYTLWDTFRTTIPLFTLFQQSRVIDITRSLIDIYQHEGYMPDGRSGMSNGITQGGSNADMVVAEVFLKNLGDNNNAINWTLAYEALLKDAEHDPWERGIFEGRMFLPYYKLLGYIPFPTYKTLSYAYVPCSKTIEYSTNDWSIALVAKKLNKTDDYIKYHSRAKNWENLWYPNMTVKGAKGFILPRFINGSFDTSWNVFNTTGYTPYYEGSAWEYSLDILHDVKRLIYLAGGPQAFERRLDKTFKDKTYLTPYFYIGNEPDFFHPCLYHFIGKQWKSAKLIRDILKRKYGKEPGGIPGNDDSGAMGSWFVFHAMGIYPMAGQDIYLINSPHFSNVTIYLSPNATFTILAKNQSTENIYVQSVKINGVNWNKTWFRHQDIKNGGILEVEMGDEVSTTWGVINGVNGESVVPPSMSDY
ncbi:Glycoside Hydrolase Family 92 protein [Gigaspora rosea]|uniref:Glycoside Hydrolase Family 92 protein n=1 Tax=Gigaspora rosea TaxID=44941 RepID=A0A397V0G5_9GLOM|nr:Glycoside Hydrolase Family 92 protein [Gigaspora rosea]